MKYKKSLLVLGLVAGALFVSGISFAQSLTQGYGSDRPLQRGMLVGLKKDDPRKVEAVNIDQVDRVHGVVVGANDSDVLISNDKEKVFVATTGRYPVLVSDQGGEIKVGDYITVSAMSGIGMKSNDHVPIVIGKATEVFSGKEGNIIVGTASIKDSNNKERVINIARITVDLGVGRNPLQKTDESLPAALKRAGELVAGKPVSPIRVYISLLILAVSAAIAGSLTYSAVRSGLIAIGRNPLGKRAIIRGMLQVIIIGFMVFIAGIFGVYLLLKL